MLYTSEAAGYTETARKAETQQNNEQLQSTLLLHWDIPPVGA